MWKYLTLLCGLLAASAHASTPDATLANIKSSNIISPLQQQTAQDRRQALCLALAIYHEARGENLDGQIAVGQVVLNRIDASHQTICETVWRHGQFQWTRRPVSAQTPRELAAWRDVQYTALVLLKTQPIDYTQGATMFFNNKLCHPKWHGTVTARFGNHVFMRPAMASLYE